MKHFYLELLCRDESGGRPDARHICLKLEYAWQEGPDDLHLQLAHTDGDNLFAEVHEESGDYIIPSSPWLLEHLRKRFEPYVVSRYRWPTRKTRNGILVYHMGFRPDVTPYDGGVLAPIEYHQLLDTHWDSPNR